MNKYEALKNNPAINLVWLLLIVASASIGILAAVVYGLAVTNVQILSWSIGYVLTSGTNDMVLTPSLIAFVVCAVVFVLCMCKNALLKAITGGK
ncbi:hypothetical protein [Bifidobacterium aerophilum]|uniref:Uncharacterized protein n=1 Tax=Bifidobacterium aerophilum TaxID=1798155 RepID=A0A6N9Z510_9BIFI|nr:hypothetical protein [Bifidobacterium aerophilum]NEG89516.1 hypothetical protein [Bifidobacterium aerophilum]